ncbi:MAG: hypothetical protein QGI32_17820 [Candidatus Latescibacteria bacterium]|jgi:hypothetical protein|nr:hypothetical protein [Candidatus Latescibacterota bacterium]
MNDVAELGRRLLASHPLVRWPVVLMAPALLIVVYYQPLRFQIDHNYVILYGWGAGLFGLLPLFVLYRLRRLVGEPVAQSAVSPPGWPVRVLCVVVPGVAVVCLQQIDVVWGDLHTTGPLLIAYSASRFVLAVSLIALCVTAGAQVLRRCVPGLRLDGIEPGSWFVLSFFVGAALYGLLMTGIGMVGLLHLLPVAILTVPVLLLAPAELATPLRAFWRKVRADFTGLQGCHWWVRFHLAWCLLCIGVMLLLSRGLYPGSTSNDVWAHYLPYYREVLKHGSLLPNDVWYQFYISKGAGLIHMLGVLSDLFAAQLVSWSFVAVSGIIVFQLTRRFAGDASWALLATTVFYTVYRGTFFKSHDCLAAFIAFLVWALIQIDDRHGAAHRAFLVSLGVVAFCLGVYQPVGSAFPAAFLSVAIGVVACHPGLRCRLRPFATTLLPLLCGVACVLILNYAVTGLAEVVPVLRFWPLADTEKFSRVVGTSGLAYLLQVAKTPALPAFDWSWLSGAFRYRQLWPILPGSFLAAGFVAVLARAVRRQTWRETTRLYPAIVLFCFASSILLLSWISFSSSLLRILIFTTFASSIVVVLLTRAAVFAFCAPVIRRWMTMLLLCGLGVHCIGQELWYLRSVRDIDLENLTSYYVGGRSFEDILFEADRHFDNALKIADVLKIRGFIGPDTPLLNLGYDQGPAYTCPGVGLVSAVDHTYGPDHADIVFGSPEEARSILQSRGVDFFVLNRRSPLFSSVAFSRLFEPATLDLYLSMYARRDDTYLLTWRGQNPAPIPEDFTRVFELKRTAVLSYASSASFRETVEMMTTTALATWTPGSADSLQALAGRVGGLLTKFIALPVTIESNRLFLVDLVNNTESALRKLVPPLAATAFREAGDPAAAGRPHAFHSKLAGFIAEAAKVYMQRRCAGAFGKELTERLFTIDDRKPFGVMYRSRATFEQLLHGGGV